MGLQRQNEVETKTKKQKWQTPKMVDIRSVKETYSSGGSSTDLGTITKAGS